MILALGTFSAKAKESLAIDVHPTFTPITSTISNATTFQGGEFCVDISVADFNAISMFQYSIGWGDTKLKYQSVQAVASTSDLSLLVGENLTNVGILTLIGTAINEVGMTFPDETVLFQICFEAIGEIGDCTPVAFTGFPLGIEVTAVETGSVDIGMMSDNGEVCIKTELLINDAQTFDVDCSNAGAGAIQLAVSGAEPPYQYQWENANGFVGNTKNIFGLDPGTYFVSISDSSDPPIVIDSLFTVLGDLVPPELTMEGAKVLNCNHPILSLPIEIENGGNDPSIFWTTDDGHFVEGQNTLMPTVDKVGDYELIVINPENSCSDTLLIVVTENFTRPEVIAESNGSLNCQINELEINASNSSAGTHFLYQWNSLDGNIISIENDLMILVDQPGFYDLMILDTLNGCADSARVEVVENRIPPIIDIEMPQELNCERREIELIGTVNSDSTHLWYNWLTTDGVIENGNLSLNPIVTSRGVYQLVALDTTNFCSDSASVVVEMDTITPFVNILLSENLSCTETSVLLDATGSSMGNDLIYEWSDPNGVVNEVGTPFLEVDEIGIYQLRIQNNLNGCQDSFSIEVLEDNSALLVDFELVQMTCDDFASIKANLPQGTTGQWESLGNAIVLDENAAETEVEGLSEGNNLFVWTLSTDICPNYDQDTLIVHLETLPIAQDDYFEIAPLPISEELNLVANDGITVTENWELELVNNPSFGEIEKISEGEVQFVNSTRESGTLSFSYQLCNSSCIELCDRAEVTIQIDASLLIDTTIEIPSGITPNGDGQNEAFVISFLEETPEAFPSNQLTVFNRWGELVYQAKPYQNDWNGTTNSGKKLAEGTYYYILQLSLNSGVIYQGEITILR